MTESHPFGAAVLAELQKLDGPSALLVFPVVAARGCGLGAETQSVLVEILPNIGQQDQIDFHRRQTAFIAALTMWDCAGSTDDEARERFRIAGEWVMAAGLWDAAMKANAFLRAVCAAGILAVQDGPEAASQTMH